MAALLGWGAAALRNSPILRGGLIILAVLVVLSVITQRSYRAGVASEKAANAARVLQIQRKLDAAGVETAELEAQLRAARQVRAQDIRRLENEAATETRGDGIVPTAERLRRLERRWGAPPGNAIPGGS